MPPLRERASDIPALVQHFVAEYGAALNKRVDVVENLALLERYSWPGNIRELRNVVERAMILAAGPRVTIGLPQRAIEARNGCVRLADVQREHIRTVLNSTGWRIRGAGGAADRLGLRPTTLETRMAKLGLTRPKAS
jgi:DNA-binding NtrC family response regulator